MSCKSCAAAAASSSSCHVLLCLVVPLVVAGVVVLRLDLGIYILPSIPLSSSSSSSSKHWHARSVGTPETHPILFHAQQVSKHSKSATTNRNQVKDKSRNVALFCKAGNRPSIGKKPDKSRNKGRGLHSSHKFDNAILDNAILDNTIPGFGNVERKVRKLHKLEAGLARARKAIREAAQTINKTLIEDADYVPQGPIYRNSYAFHRSYLEMEKLFKVFVYKEGVPPLVHDGPCRSIYSSEGLFIHGMETTNVFCAKDFTQAHVFFLPFSVAKMITYVYTPNSFNLDPIKRFMADYVNIITEKYPYWNRSLGADHFIVSCHDWENQDVGADNGLIGQFGVGFYSAFLVAEKLAEIGRLVAAMKMFGERS